LACIDKLKLFGAVREIDSLDESPLTARERAAGAAAAGALLLRSATDATKGLPEAAEELRRRTEKMDSDAKADLAQFESPLGKSLLYRKIWLSAMLKAQRSRLDIQDELDADPELARIYEEVKRERDTKDQQPVISIKGQEELREIGFGHLPANLRIVSIPFLCHFTRTENLSSILKHGLVPVAECPKLDIVPFINDTERFDRRTNTSSLSIGHPNFRMLHKYRQLNPDADWVVIAVNIATVLKLDALFCRHNAADARISRISDNNLQKNKSFQAMFERPRHYTGKARFNEPTDDQAEVLIPRIIPPSEINGVFFLSEKSRVDYSLACGNRAVFGPEHSKAIFGKRFDDSLRDTAQIIQSFDLQIDQLEQEFRRDPRLFSALDSRIREVTASMREIDG
jgi:hypothetical protein